MMFHPFLQILLPRLQFALFFFHHLKNPFWQQNSFVQGNFEKLVVQALRCRVSALRVHSKHLLNKVQKNVFIFDFRHFFLQIEGEFTIFAEIWFEFVIKLKTLSFSPLAFIRSAADFENFVHNF